MSEVDRQVARERNLKRKTMGGTMNERIMAIKKRVTAGRLVLKGRSFALNKDVLQHSEDVEKQKLGIEEAAKESKDLAYLEICAKADLAMLENNTILDISKWKKAKDILYVVKSLRLDGDPAMPTKRDDIVRRYNETKHRIRRFVNEGSVRKYQMSLIAVNGSSSTSVSEGQGNDEATTLVQM